MKDRAGPRGTKVQEKNPRTREGGGSKERNQKGIEGDE